jgi:hypothetical protein
MAHRPKVATGQQQALRNRAIRKRLGSGLRVQLAHMGHNQSCATFRHDTAYGMQTNPSRGRSAAASTAEANATGATAGEGVAAQGG